MSKKILVSCFLLIVHFAVHAQSMRNGLGIQFDGIDFYGPQTGKYLVDAGLYSSSMKVYWDPGLRLSYLKKISKHFEMAVVFNASFLHYPQNSYDTNYFNLKKQTTGYVKPNLFFVINTLIQYNAWAKEKFIFTPNIFTGLGFGFYKNNIVYNAPVGVGINCKLSKSIYLNASSSYNVPLEKTSQTYLVHSLGMIFWLKLKGKIPEVTKVEEVPFSSITMFDTDNDGVPDDKDLCPTLPGRKESNGCPDTDNDGFFDNDDKCPKEAGIAKYQGCPIPDRDNDGFNDEIDECPDESFEDNNGCPYVKKEDREKVDLAAKGIYYKSNSAEIDSLSYGNLNEIVNLMLARPELLLEIEGHTDNIGSEKANLKLSQARADACKNYFINTGIEESRISSIGYGDMMPIADNETEDGRAQNRRTVFELKVEEKK